MQPVPWDGICLVLAGVAILLLGVKMAKAKAGGKNREQLRKEYYAGYVESVRRHRK